MTNKIQPQSSSSSSTHYTTFDTNRLAGIAANNTTQQRPVCAKCNEAFIHVENPAGKMVWTCTDCCRTLSEEAVLYSCDNLNAPYKGQTPPSKMMLAKEEKEQEEYGRAKQFSNASSAARPRITSGIGTTNYTTSIPSSVDGEETTTSSDSSNTNHSFFQGFNPYEHLIQERRGSDERSRIPGGTIPTQNLHELDRSLLQEYPYMQIKSVKELPREPNDKSIVPKDPRAPKKYSRYSLEESNDNNDDNDY
jgi:ribosomal protein L37AE/L43A